MSAERYSKGDGVKMGATKAAVYYNLSPEFKETWQKFCDKYEL